MRHLFLIRIVNGTFGVLVEKGLLPPLCVTLEDPWAENQPDDPQTPLDEASCIPAGSYLCQRVKSNLISEMFGGARDETFEIQDVPGRDKVRLHPGNDTDDTKGCVLTGKMFGISQGKPAILSSKWAFEDFMNHLKGEDQFMLDVIQPFDEVA